MGGVVSWIVKVADVVLGLPQASVAVNTMEIELLHPPLQVAEVALFVQVMAFPHKSVATAPP